MTKKEILIDEDGVAIEFGSYFEWLSISRKDEKLIAAVRVKGNRVHAKLKPKHVRRIARALLALADQVDPPAPVVHYFAVGGKTFYRVNDSSIELYSKWTTRWIPTTTGATTVEELNRHWYGHLTEITPDALPLAARQA